MTGLPRSIWGLILSFILVRDQGDSAVSTRLSARITGGNLLELQQLNLVSDGCRNLSDNPNTFTMPYNTYDKNSIHSIFEKLELKKTALEQIVQSDANFQFSGRTARNFWTEGRISDENAKKIIDYLNEEGQRKFPGSWNTLHASQLLKSSTPQTDFKNDWIQNFEKTDHPIAQTLHAISREFHYDAIRVKETFKQLVSKCLENPVVVCPFGGFRRRAVVLESLCDSYNHSQHPVPLYYTYLLGKSSITASTVLFVDDFANTGRSFVGEIDRWMDSPTILKQLKEVKNLYIGILVAFDDTIDTLNDKLSQLNEQGIPSQLLVASRHNAETELITSPNFATPANLPNITQEIRSLCEKYNWCSFHQNSGESNSFGVGGRGALVSFYYNTPKSSIPLLWSVANGWKPLFASVESSVNVIPNTEDFYGRQTELEDLEKKAKERSLPVLVTGESGIGKTYLLAKFASANPQSSNNLRWYSIHPHLPIYGLSTWAVSLLSAEKRSPVSSRQSDLDILLASVSDLDSSYIIIIDRIDFLLDDPSCQRFLEKLSSIKGPEKPFLILCGDVDTTDAAIAKLLPKFHHISPHESTFDFKCRANLLEHHGSKLPDRMQNAKWSPVDTFFIAKCLQVFDITKEELSDTNIRDHLIKQLWSKCSQGEKFLLAVTTHCYPPRREPLIQKAFHFLTKNYDVNVCYADSYGWFERKGFPVFRPVTLDRTRYLIICASLARAFRKAIGEIDKALSKNADLALGNAATEFARKPTKSTSSNDLSRIEATKIGAYHYQEAGEIKQLANLIGKSVGPFEREGYLRDLERITERSIEKITNEDENSHEAERIRLVTGLLKMLRKQSKHDKLVEVGNKYINQFNNNATQATILYYMGVGLATMGKSDAAIKKLRKAQLLHENSITGGPFSSISVKIETRLAQTLIETGRLGEALTLLAKISDDCNHGDAQPQREKMHSKAVIFRHLGAISTMVGMNQRARQYFAEAKRLNVELGDKEGEAICLYMLGRLVWGSPFSIERFDQALRLTDEALNLLEAYCPKNFWWKSAMLEQKASIYLDRVWTRLGNFETSSDRLRDLKESERLVVRLRNEGLDDNIQRNAMMVRGVELSLLEGKLTLLQGGSNSSSEVINSWTECASRAADSGAVYLHAILLYEIAHLYAREGDILTSLNKCHTAIRVLSQNGLSLKVQMVGFRMLYYITKVAAQPLDGTIAAFALLSSHLVYYTKRNQDDLLEGGAGKTAVIHRALRRFERLVLNCLCAEDFGVSQKMLIKECFDLYLGASLEVEAVDFACNLEWILCNANQASKPQLSSEVFESTRAGRMRVEAFIHNQFDSKTIPERMGAVEESLDKIDNLDQG